MAFFQSKKTKDRIKKHSELIKAINNKKVEAGWFETNRYTAGKGIRPSQVGQSIAEIARINELGTATIPARPFMRLARENFNRDRNDLQVKIFKRLMNGEINYEQALAQIGLAMEGYIVKSIKNGNWEPNALSTRRAKGFQKDTPLINTSQMFRSVTSKVS